MRNTNIYVETSTAYPGKKQREYGYLIECGGKTVEGHGTAVESYNNAVLIGIKEALKRFVRPAHIKIHTRNMYVANMIRTNLEEWKRNGYRNAKGESVSEYWKEVGQGLEMHEFEVCKMEEITIEEVKEKLERK